MGRRSRNRAPAAARAADPTPARRRPPDERPRAPWHPFPLVELCALAVIFTTGSGRFAGVDRILHGLFARRDLRRSAGQPAAA